MACLAAVLLIGFGVRVNGLDRHGYALDEAWSLEIANGRGSVHEHLPLNRVAGPRPALSSLAGAAPWWRVWSNVEVTHPPLYPLLLRGWEDAFGDGDAAGRLFSVTASLVAIALLFDIVRLQAGLSAAVWAGLLMALATPQVEHARLARSYTLLAAVALAAADATVRIRAFGVTPRRWWCLTAAVLATLLTHYFCVGALVGLAAAVVTTAPRDVRRPILKALGVAAGTFAVIWAPFMWQQRHLFATDDPNTLFLTAADANHAALTVLRIALAPVAMLLPFPTGTAIVWAVPVGLGLLLLPLVPAVRRRSPWAPFWWCWTWGTISVVAGMDFARGTNHLAFPRYIWLAGPGVCALVPTLARAGAGRRWWPAALAATATVAACAFAVPDADPFADPRAVVAALPVRPGPGDLLVVAAGPAELVGAESAFLSLTRYLPPPACGSFAVLTRPADADVTSAARRSRFVFLVTSATDYHAYLPDARVIAAARYRGLGNVWTLRYDR